MKGFVELVVIFRLIVLKAATMSISYLTNDTLKSILDTPLIYMALYYLQQEIERLH